MRHSVKGLRKGLARHKKLSIVFGSVIGLVAAASVAFAVTVLGGQVTGSIQSNGAQPDVDWVSSGGSAAPPAMTGCTTQDGSADSTASGSASLSSDSQTLQIYLNNVWANETCTFSGWVDDPTNAAVTVSGITLTATDSSGDETTLSTTLSGAPITLQPDSTGTSPTQIEFTVTVPDVSSADSFTISGALDLAVATNGSNSGGGYNTGTSKQD